MSTGIALLRDERGVALALALIVILILSVITLGVAQVTTSELDIHTNSRWDNIDRYLAHAAVEHQIFLLKQNQTAAAVPYQNYPLLTSEISGCGSLWYVTTLNCMLNCTGSTNTLVQWEIIANGERWNTPDCVTWTLLQQRQVRAQVQITYQSVAGTMIPQSVSFLRWEEVYP